MIEKLLLLLLLLSCYCLPSDVFTAFILSKFGIFAYKDFTSSGTRYELSCTVSTAFSLVMKLLVIWVGGEGVILHPLLVSFNN